MIVRKNLNIVPQMYILLGVHYIAEYGVPSHHRGSCVIAGRLDTKYQGIRCELALENAF